MNVRTLSAIAIMTAAISSPVFAQETYGTSTQKPAHALRHYRGTYNEVQGPGFVTPRPAAYGESGFDNGFDHSRIGGRDPDLNPAAN